MFKSILDRSNCVPHIPENFENGDSTTSGDLLKNMLGSQQLVSAGVQLGVSNCMSPHRPILNNNEDNSSVPPGGRLGESKTEGLHTVRDSLYDLRVYATGNSHQLFHGAVSNSADPFAAANPRSENRAVQASSFKP